MKQQRLDWAEEEKHREDEKSGEDRGHIEAEADRHPDRSHDPDRGGCRKAVDLVALAEDCAGSEETDSGYDLRRDSRWVCRSAKSLEPKPRKQTCADTDQPESLYSRRMAVKFALEADGNRKQCSDQQAEGKIDVTKEWQLFSLYPACRRVGPCRVARRETQEGRAGRGCSRSL